MPHCYTLVLDSIWQPNGQMLLLATLGALSVVGIEIYCQSKLYTCFFQTGFFQIVLLQSVMFQTVWFQTVFYQPGFPSCMIPNYNFRNVPVLRIFEALQVTHTPFAIFTCLAFASGSIFSMYILNKLICSSNR